MYIYTALYKNEDYLTTCIITKITWQLALCSALADILKVLKQLMVATFSLLNQVSLYYDSWISLAVYAGLD